MRLWIFLTLIINGIILLAFLSFGFYYANKQNEIQLNYIKTNIHHLGLSIAASAANDLLTQRYDKLQEILLQQVAIGSVQRIEIIDATGNIVSQAERNAAGDGQVNQLQPSHPVQLAASDYLDDEYYIHTHPITDFDVLGWIRVTSSLQELNQTRQRVWLHTGIITLFVWALTVLSLTPVLRRISTVLKKAADFTDQLDQHQGKQLSPYSRIIEVTELHTALNQVSTRLQQQHQALTDKSKGKKAIFDVIEDCLITLDQHCKILECNDATLKMLGYWPKEMIGKTLGYFMLTSEKSNDLSQRMLNFLYSGEQALLNQTIELNALLSDGNTIPVEIKVTAFSRLAQPLLLVKLHDISEIKQLQQTEKLNAALLKRSITDLKSRQFALDQHAIVSITDLKGDITYVNDKFCQIAKYTRKELLGKNHRLIKSHIHTSEFYQDIWRTIRSGQIWHGEIANLARDGAIYWVASSIVPLQDSNGVTQQYIAIRTDITQQKRIESRLKESYSRLETTLDDVQQAERQLKEATDRELHIGNQIQRSLLFGELPRTVGKISLSGYSESAKGIDGDFYDYLRVNENCFDLMIGDVMGKGITAALVGAGFKQQLNRAIIETTIGRDQHLPAPHDIINAVHRKLTPQLITLERFITLIYLRINTDTHQVSYVDAGHSHAIVMGPSGCQLENCKLSGGNLPLGVQLEENYQQYNFAFKPGTLIFLFSDGMTEARNALGEEFGVAKLAKLVDQMNRADVPVPILVQGVRKALNIFENYNLINDDRTCVAVKHHDISPSSPLPINIELAWDLTQLTPLRQEIATLAQHSEMADEARDALILAAFEATTNIIRHAPCPLPDATVHCTLQDLGDRIRLCLYYLGEPHPYYDLEPDFTGGKDGGFGMFIIRNSVDHLRYDSPATGICRIEMIKNKIASHSSLV